MARGGARKGAGRKKLPDEEKVKPVKSISFKVNKDLYLQIEQINHLLYFDNSMVHESIVCVYNFLNVKTIDLLVQIRRILRK